MLLKQLQYFSAVARLGSYTLAAEESFISQSAISQQVKALETELGVKLVERQGRSFRLTPEGELVAQRGAEIVAQADQLRFDVAHLENEPSKLRVGYLNRYEGWEVQAAIAAFAQRHPDVEISAHAGSHEDLYDRVLAGELDILVNDRRRQLSDAFVNRFLFKGFDYVEVSEASELSWHDTVTVEDLRGQTCILVAPANQRESEAVYYQNVMNFHCTFVFAETLEQARMMVAGNRGILPVETRTAEGRSGSVLRRIPLVDATGAQRIHEYYAFWLKAHTTPLNTEFATILEGLVG